MHAIGVNGFNKNIEIGHAWLCGKETDDYIWFLKALASAFDESSILYELSPPVILTDRELALVNALTIIFPRSPHLLCRWHVFQAIKGNIRRGVSKANWDIFMLYIKLMIESDEEEEYIQREEHLSANKLSKMHWILIRPDDRDLTGEDLKTIREYVHSIDNELRINESTILLPYEQHRAFIGYYEKEWHPYYTKFVACYTNRIQHFGNTSTSRLEGQHRALKQNIASATSGLYESFKSMKIVLEAQRKRHTVEAGSAKI